MILNAHPMDRITRSHIWRYSQITLCGVEARMPRENEIHIITIRGIDKSSAAVILSTEDIWMEGFNFLLHIESVKTTSMEKESTVVRRKNKALCETWK